MSATLRQTLLEPARAIALSDGELEEHGRTRHIVLLTPWRSGAAFKATLIEVRSTQPRGKFAPPSEWASELRVLDGRDALTVELEALYVRANPDARFFLPLHLAAPRLLWLGGSANAHDLPHDWRLRITSAGAVRGFEVEIIEDPHRRVDAANARLHDVRPRALVIWSPRAAGGASVYSASVAAGSIIELLEPEFDNALLKATMELDVLLDAGEQGGARPRDWSEFEERMRGLASEAFVVTENAISAAHASAYGDAGRMWDHVEALARMAGDFAAREGELGARFADVASTEYGIEVALHDANLGALADFEHEGVPYRCEPHIKVDDAKAWIEVGRVYFAIDPERSRIIVEHIGGKLY